jgi:hypothetical protein
MGPARSRFFAHFPSQSFLTHRKTPPNYLLRNILTSKSLAISAFARISPISMKIRNFGGRGEGVGFHCLRNAAARRVEPFPAAP